jgi:hypothetical protein
MHFGLIDSVSLSFGFRKALEDGQALLFHGVG